MVKKIGNKLFVLMLVLTIVTPIGIVAGGETDPEIIDDTDDVIGFLTTHETIFRLLNKIGVFSLDSSLHLIDIESADFFEKQNTPEYLFVTIKINNLEYNQLRAFYGVTWEYQEKQYQACCHTYADGQVSWFSAGRAFGFFDNWAYKKGLQADISDCTINDDADTITLQIPKSLVGNPKRGDILTYTYATSGLRFISETMTFLLFPSGELARDQTPNGQDYVIQY
jgi:hypothetical protein